MRWLARGCMRVRRLQDAQQRAAVFGLAQRLALELGITGEELLAEADALRRRARTAGLTTSHDLVAFIAAETGISESELRTDLALTRERPG